MSQMPSFQESDLHWTVAFILSFLIVLPLLLLVFYFGRLIRKVLRQMADALVAQVSGNADNENSDENKLSDAIQQSSAPTESQSEMAVAPEGGKTSTGKETALQIELTETNAVPGKEEQ